MFLADMGIPTSDAFISAPADRFKRSDHSLGARACERRFHADQCHKEMLKAALKGPLEATIQRGPGSEVLVHSTIAPCSGSLERGETVL